jgi:AraC-like DNA-binding protein
MENLFRSISSDPGFYRQFRCSDALIALYNCPLKNKFADLWSDSHYFVYVTEGKKIWHTPSGPFSLEKGSCVFVRKGASIVEQFFDTPFCLMILFMTDEFITDTLHRGQRGSLPAKGISFPSVIPVNRSAPIDAFFHSMGVYFAHTKAPEGPLLELKFRELVLTIADDHANAVVNGYFHSINSDAPDLKLRHVMEDNYRYNLKLEEYADLSNRSLSAFKRDFQKLFGTTPGKWLLEQRLEHARQLLLNGGKTVSDAAFESGFENTSHFSRAFKTRYGISPAAVRLKSPS